MTHPLVADIEGYASVFNQPDLNGDTIAPGAFTMSLRAASAIRMLYQHAAETPIGRWTAFRQDGHGLFVTGELILSSPRALEVHALLAGGALDGLSIGYQTTRATKAPGGRKILEAELWEVSIVTFPMAPAARITHVGAPRHEHSPQDYAAAFKESAAQTAGRAPARPPTSPDAGARQFADALRSAAHKLSV